MSIERKKEPVEVLLEALDAAIVAHRRASVRVERRLDEREGREEKRRGPA